jgi:tetratricopeptide (TPR) repeat protein
MALIKCKECDEQVSDKAVACPHCGVQVKDAAKKKPKKWHERTSVTLCVAAGLIVAGFGFIHVITGVVSPYGLPFDIVLKESFGYRETFINARKIISLPYEAATLKYPLGCEALQRRNYIESGSVFETRMSRQLREKIEAWQTEFERALNKPRQRWQDRLLGHTSGIETDPEDPNACNNQGITLAKEGYYEAAIARFSRALQRNPVFAEAYYNRGLVDLAIGQLGQAISDLTKALEIKPGFAEARAARAPVYFEMGRYEDAISDFTRIVESNPEAVEVYFSRSLAAYMSGDYAGAWHDVHKIQSLDSHVPSGFLALLRAASGKQR